MDAHYTKGKNDEEKEKGKKKRLSLTPFSFYVNVFKKNNLIC